MDVTEVKIKLVPQSDNKLLAFASITIDRCFVVRDIKIIQGKISYFVAMPSRKITDHCIKCSCKNHLQSAFCNQCGAALDRARTRPDARGRSKLHADIAHPINARCRQAVQDAIFKGYEDELARSKLPGYVPAVMDDDAGPDEMEDSRTPSTIEKAVMSRDGYSEPHADINQGVSSQEQDQTPPVDAGGFGILS